MLNSYKLCAEILDNLKIVTKNWFYIKKAKKNCFTGGYNWKDNESYSQKMAHVQNPPVQNPSSQIWEPLTNRG